MDSGLETTVDGSLLLLWSECITRTNRLQDLLLRFISQSIARYARSNTSTASQFENNRDLELELRRRRQGILG